MGPTLKKKNKKEGGREMEGDRRGKRQKDFFYFSFYSLRFFLRFTEI